MPRSEASRLSSVLSNWAVGIGAFGDLRLALELVLRRRRARLPLETSSAPGIGRRARAAQDRPAEVAERQQITDGEHCCARGGEHVEQRELRRILVIA